MARTARRLTRTIAALAIALGLALGMLLLQPSAAQAAESDTIYSLVNDARWSQGSAGLVRNTALDAVAAGWAAKLAEAGTLSHNPQYSSQIPSGWISAAENVAQGYGGGAAMHEGWMNSPGHRANILGNFTDIGIAYLEAGGTTWGVEVFANYPGSVGPAAPVAAPVEPAPVAEAPAAPAPEPTTPAQIQLPDGKGSRASFTTATGDLDTPTSSAAGQDVPASTFSPLWAAALAAVIVVAVGIRSYLLRGRSPRQSRH